MSDEQQNQPILSAVTIARQKSVLRHFKIAQFCWPTIFDVFVGWLFVYRTTDFVYIPKLIKSGLFLKKPKTQKSPLGWALKKRFCNSYFVAVRLCSV